MDAMAMLNSPEGKKCLEEIRKAMRSNNVHEPQVEGAEGYEQEDDATDEESSSYRGDANRGNTNDEGFEEGGTNGDDSNRGDTNDEGFEQEEVSNTVNNGGDTNINRGNTDNGFLTSLEEESNSSDNILRDLFNSTVSDMQGATKSAGYGSDSSAKLLLNTQDNQPQFYGQESFEFSRNINIFQTFRESPPLDLESPPLGIVIVDKTERDSKKRKINRESRYKSKVVVKKIENALGAPRPFPRGTLDEKEWMFFFTLLKKFESERNMDCKRLWTYKRYEDVYKIMHYILKNMMLQKKKNHEYLDETEIFNMRNVFGIWYRSTFQEKGPFQKIAKGIRKGKGWMFSDEEVDALDVGMYMYPADTTQNRFYYIRYDCLCGPIFQDTRTPFQLYDKARSLNVERPWEQLCRFYELQENLTKEIMAAFEERKTGKQS